MSTRRGGYGQHFMQQPCIWKQASPLVIDLIGRIRQDSAGTKSKDETPSLIHRLLLVPVHVTYWVSLYKKCQQQPPPTLVHACLNMQDCKEETA